MTQTEQKPDDWCECYGCTTMPCVNEAQKEHDRDMIDIGMTGRSLSVECGRYD